MRILFFTPASNIHRVRQSCSSICSSCCLPVFKPIAETWRSGPALSTTPIWIIQRPSLLFRHPQLRTKLDRGLQHTPILLIIKSLILYQNQVHNRYLTPHRCTLCNRNTLSLPCFPRSELYTYLVDSLRMADWTVYGLRFEVLSYFLEEMVNEM